MKKQKFILVLLLFFFFVSTLNAEQNRYYVADRELQRVYEHFTGISLELAIEQLLAAKHGVEAGSGNIIIRINDGRANNSLYIGSKNWLDILVTNSVPLEGMSLGFELTCKAGTFKIIEGYGTISSTNTSAPNILRVHSGAFFDRDVWTVQMNSHNYPDSLLITAKTLPEKDPLPAHISAKVLYSMQIEFPEETPEINEGFCIDNIFIPPDDGWLFAEADSGMNYAPDFQGNPSQSPFNPDAPATCFDIVKPPECWKETSNPNIVHFRDGDVAGPITVDLDRPPGIYKNHSGVIGIMVRMNFKGSIEDLTSLGAYVSEDRLVKNWIDVRFPLKLLPQICQIEGVISIKTVDVGQTR